MRPANLAAPKRPDSGDGAEERTFSRTRSSPQENGVSAQKREIDIGDKRLTIGEIEIHTLNCQMRDIPVGTPDTAAGRRLDAHTFKGALEAGKPLDYRAPFSDLLIRLDKEA